MLSFGSVIESLSGVVDWIESTVETISGVFSDIDFTILYSWLPSDIAAVITAIIAILLFLAIFGILRRVLFFLG